MKYQEWQELRRMQQTIEKRLRVVFYVLLFGLIFSLFAIKFAPAQKIASTNLTGPAGSVIGRNFPTNWLYVPVDSNGYLLVSGIGGGGGGSTNPYADLYPAACGVAGAPSYCSGSTPDAWIRSACASLPSTGGFISLRGLTGNIVNSVTCSTPTKQVIMYADNTSHLSITESDGGTAFPLDNGSMFIGQGAGQCVFNTGGIHLAGTANVTAIVGPAHTDGSQENFTAEGLCLSGATGATVSQGIIYTQSNFANTTIDNNNIFVTNTTGIKVINSSSMELANNWINGTDGTSVTNSPLVIESSGIGGCGAGTITVIDGQIEHAFGGGPEIDIHGDGAGALVCNVHIIGVGIERNTSSASTIGVKISDCWNCSIDHVNASGTTGGTDLVNVSQTAAGRTKNVNITNLYASATYTNAINDSTPGGTVLTSSAWPQITTYYAAPGYLGSPITTLGDIIAGTSTGVEGRVAGNTSATIGVLTETGNGTVSASPIWTPGSGTGNIALTVSPQFITPYVDRATGLSLELMGPYFGLHGAGSAIFTYGATAQVGTGGGYSVPVNVTGVFSDTNGGEVTFTTGSSGITGAGTVFTVLFPGLWSTVPSVGATIHAVTPNGVALQPFMELANSSGIVTGTFTTDVPLALNTNYHAQWGFVDGQ